MTDAVVCGAVGSGDGQLKVFMGSRETDLDAWVEIEHYTSME